LQHFRKGPILRQVDFGKRITILVHK